jgi:hypothetical protein
VKRWVWICGALGCSSPPQTQDETAVTWTASWTAESGINATVAFPAPNESVAASAIQQGIGVDGGTFAPFSDPNGNGFSLAGQTSVSASFVTARLTGLGSGTGLPQTSLARGVADGGTQFYFFVNKSGLPSIGVTFEYTVQRNCGVSCGGKRSWTYSNPSLGTGTQVVTLTYAEEKQP